MNENARDLSESIKRYVEAHTTFCITQSEGGYRLGMKEDADRAFRDMVQCLSNFHLSTQNKK